MGKGEKKCRCAHALQDVMRKKRRAKRGAPDRMHRRGAENAISPDASRSLVRLRDALKSERPVEAVIPIAAAGLCLYQGRPECMIRT